MIEQLMLKVHHLGDIDYACHEFAQAMVRSAARQKGTCINPITGSAFIRPGDSILAEVRKAMPRLRALFLLGNTGPSSMALPINYQEREELKLSDNPEYVLWALYGSSLECNSYDLDAHPSFSNYARGALLSPRGAILVRQMPNLLSKYRPEELKGLDLASLVWKGYRQ
jgi:hypothetical protein